MPDEAGKSTGLTLQVELLLFRQGSGKPLSAVAVPAAGTAADLAATAHTSQAHGKTPENEEAGKYCRQEGQRCFI